MTSVLNGMGYQNGSNPIGIQIRNTQRDLENTKADMKMLLGVLETKAPEVFNEYKRLKNEQEERAAMERARAAEEARRAAMQNAYYGNSNRR